MSHYIKYNSGGGGGSGDVVGPASSTDNALARFNGTTGKLLQNSIGILDDSGNLSGIASLTIDSTGAVRTSTGAGETLLLQAYDVDGASYTTFGTLTANNTPTFDLDDAVTKAGGYIYRAGGTDVPVTDGGTGLSSATAYAVLCGGTTGTGAFQSIASVGSAGQVLTSNGAGALPTFQAVAGTGDVVGPASSTDNALVRFDSTTGKLIENSTAILSDTGDLSALTSITMADTGALRTTTTNNDTLLLQAYDVDGAAYTTFATLTAANTPTMDLDTAVTINSSYIYRAGGTDIPVADGGTGISTATPYGVICGGTSGTGAFQSITPIGSAGEVLTSNGAGSLPSWQPAGAGSGDVTGPGSSTDNALARFDSTTGKIIQNSGVIVDDSNNVTGVVSLTLTGNLNLPVTNSGATAGVITWNSTQWMHIGATASDAIYIGNNAGKLTAATTNNGSIGIGTDALRYVDSASSSNIAIGYQALPGLTNFNISRNVVMGYQALNKGATNTDSNVIIGHSAYATPTGRPLGCVAIGYQALNGSQAGDVNYNIGIGHQAGTSLTTTDGNNILIGSSGVAGDNNTIRIGTQGTGNKQQNKAFIAGIYNTAVGATAGVVLSDSAGQLGGLAGAANTFFVGGTKPSFTGSPTASGTITGNALVSTTTINGGGALTITAGGASIAGGLVLPTGTNSITSIDTYGATVGGTNAAVLIDNTGLMGTTTSSLRYKENVEDMGDRSSVVLKLRPVNFNYKKDKCKYMQWGLIAEEVHEVMPEIVNYDKEGRPDNVRYHDLPAIMLNEMKKMAAKIELLEQEVALLKKA